MNILTTEDVKTLLKISDKKAKALMRTEGFPSIRIGQEYRVEEQAMIDWMKETKIVKLDYNKC